MQFNPETHELPTISMASHTHATYDAAHIGAGVGDGVLRLGSINQLIAANNEAWGPGSFRAIDNNKVAWEEERRRAAYLAAQTNVIKTENKMPSRTMRVVQVFIIDPDEKLPLDKAVLYQGSPTLTDKTDQELFFDLDMRTLLSDHNKIREVTEDKKASASTTKIQFLEAARIRDLKMSVVNLATF